MFAEYLGIRPWEMDLLTVEDFTDYVGYLDEKIRQSKQQQ